MVRGALGDPEGIGYTLFYTTDYVFAGLAVALPFQAGLFNIGGEGQAALGGPRRRHRRRGFAVIVCGMLDGIARGHIGQSLRTLWTAPVRHAA